MRFPQLEQLALPCRLERIVPGQLHADGRRYLPLLVLQPLGPRQTANRVEQVTPPELRLGVVDRHHRVDVGLVGRSGMARLLCALSVLRLQRAPYRQGWLPASELAVDYAVTDPLVYGQVQTVLAWDVTRGELPYTALYAELLVDVGAGLIGVRTSTTADDLATAIGAAQFNAGDWIALERSRIDILDFVVQGR